MILNEAHLLLIVAHYRRQIVVIKILRRVLCSFVCMTITLLSFVKLKMKILLHFIQCDTLRASNDRPNLEYRVQWLKTIKKISCREKKLVAKTMKIYR